ncbi:MAG: hypothetical protein AABY36_05105 [Campylobacterota bacterium]
MHTIHLQVEDNLYNEIVKKGINVQDELKLALNKILYKKEYQIADEIKQAFDEVKQFKDGKIDLTNADDFLLELKSGH